MVRFGQPGVVPDLPKIVERFASRGVIVRPDQGSAKAWSQYVLVPAVGVWAHNTTVLAIKWLVAVAPAEGLRPLLEFLTKDVSEIIVPQLAV